MPSWLGTHIKKKQKARFPWDRFPHGNLIRGQTPSKRRNRPSAVCSHGRGRGMVRHMQWEMFLIGVARQGRALTRSQRKNLGKFPVNYVNEKLREKTIHISTCKNNSRDCSGGFLQTALRPALLCLKTQAYLDRARFSKGGAHQCHHINSREIFVAQKSRNRTIKREKP